MIYGTLKGRKFYVKIVITFITYHCSGVYQKKQFFTAIQRPVASRKLSSIAGKSSLVIKLFLNRYKFFATE